MTPRGDNPGASAKCDRINERACREHEAPSPAQDTFACMIGHEISPRLTGDGMPGDGCVWRVERAHRIANEAPQGLDSVPWP